MVINSSGHRNDKEIFVGLSRLGGNTIEDCSVTVVCNDANYSSYGKEWSVFEEKGDNTIGNNENLIKYDNFIEIEEDFKIWLLKSSGVKPGRIYCEDFDVYDNKSNSELNNYFYLNRYFFQTYSFIKQFWGDVLRNKSVSERLLNSKELNILSVGTGRSEERR